MSATESETTSTARTHSAGGAVREGRPDLHFLNFDVNVWEKFDTNFTDGHTWLHKILTFAEWWNDQISFFFGFHLLKDAYTWFSN